LDFQLAIWPTFSFIIKFIMGDALAAISMLHARGTAATIAMPDVILG
jgi:hypothetical protein